MPISFNKSANKYDLFICVLVASLMAGEYGGALQLVRVLCILGIPSLSSAIRGVTLSYINPIKHVILFVWTLSVVSLIWSGSFSLGIKEIVYYIVHLLLLLEIVVFSYRAQMPLKSLAAGWSLALLITVLIAIWEIRTGQHLSTSKLGADATFNFEGQSLLRVFAAATFYNYNQFETFICYCTPFLIYMTLTAIKPKQLLILFILLGISFYVIVINASRSASAAVLIFYALTLKNIFANGRRSLIVYLLLIMASIFLIYQNSSEIFFNLDRRILSSGYESARFEIWETGWQALEKTLFLGFGAGGINTGDMRTTNIIGAPHNLFLEVLLRFGILGFAVFVYMLFKIWKNSVKVVDKTVRIVLISIFIAMPFYFITNSTYLFDASLYAFFGSLYVFVKSDYLNNMRSKRVQVRH